MVKRNRIKGNSLKQTKSKRAKTKVRRVSRKAGAAKTKRVGRKQKGGRVTFFPQSVANIGRSINTGAVNLVNNYRGLEMVPHSAPMRGHPIDNNVAFINSPRPDIISIRQQANDFATAQ